MQPVVENAGVLLVNAASSNPDITYKAGVSGFKWSFRNYPTDENRASLCSNMRLSKEDQEVRRTLRRQRLWPWRDRADQEISRRIGADIVSEDYYKDKRRIPPVLTNIRRSGAGASSSTDLPIRRPSSPANGRGRTCRQGHLDRQCRIQRSRSDQDRSDSAERRSGGRGHVPKWDTPKNHQFGRHLSQSLFR